MATLPVYTSSAFTGQSDLEIAAGASVEVRSEANDSLVTLYSDRAGTVQINNPFQADEYGRFEFFATPNSDGWRITVTSGSDSYMLRFQQPMGAAGGAQASNFMMGLLTDADAATARATLEISPAFTTGDIKPTIKTLADDGWVMMDDGTIGSATSGATTRANADCEALFELLWANISDTYAPVAGGRGASAQADWDANKTISLLKVLGRAMASAGAGVDLTSRDLGATVGAETHMLTEDEMPSHTHAPTGGGTRTDVIHPSDSGPNIATPGSGSNWLSSNLSAAGGDGAHNNMQPSTFVNFMMKL